MNNPEGCGALLKTGPNKGLRCGRKISYYDSCGIHKKDIEALLRNEYSINVRTISKLSCFKCGKKLIKQRIDNNLPLTTEQRTILFNIPSNKDWPANVKWKSIMNLPRYWSCPLHGIIVNITSTSSTDTSISSTTDPC